MCNGYQNCFNFNRLTSHCTYTNRWPQLHNKMKSFLVILLLLLSNYNKNHYQNILIGEWIGISNNKGSGLIFDFKNEKELIIGAIGTDSINELVYKYDNSNKKIYFQLNGSYEEIWFIERITNDLLTIITQDSTKLEFIKIENIKLSSTKNELIQKLKNNSWYTIYGDSKVRIDFLDSHRWDDISQPFEAMFHYSFTYPYKEKEIWNIGQYNGKLFLFYTNHQHEQVTKQIIEVDSNKIVVVSHSENDVNSTKSLEKTTEQSIEVSSKLTSKYWISIDTDTINCREWGTIPSIDEDADNFDLLSKQLKFKFNKDMSYVLECDGKKWKKGIWRLTGDGKFVILDDSRDKKNWLELNHENEKINLSKLHKFSIGKREYKLYLLSITFK
jgi:hypothetical protein